MKKEANTFVLIASGTIAFSPPQDANTWFLPRRTNGSIDLLQHRSEKAATAEEILVIGRRGAPVQPDPLPQHPLSLLRQHEAGASWGSTHPGEFCCASQYETGMDGQAGR